jgi:hypothetical protein
MHHFDFSTRKVVNPLEKVNSFIVNPYMPQTAQSLKLEKLSGDKGVFAMNVTYHKEIPCPVFPIDILQLGECMIKWSEDNKGQIIKRCECGNHKTTIYFQIIHPNLIRLDTVLFH